MNGVFSFIRNLSLAKNHQVWTPGVSKLVDELKSVRTSQVQRAKILEQLEPFVVQASFKNTKEEEILRAKADLLRLWDFLLRYMEVLLQVQQKRKVFAFVVAIMDRREFSLAAAHGIAQTSRSSKLHLQSTQRYHALLVQTFVRVVKSAGAKANSPAEFMQFHAQAAAIFFFRLPLVGGRIVNVLQQKREEQTASSNASVESKERGEEDARENGKKKYKSGEAQAGEVEAPPQVRANSPAASTKVNAMM